MQCSSGSLVNRVARVVVLMAAQPQKGKRSVRNLPAHMVQVNKKIKVSGKCGACEKKVEATITAAGPKGQSGNWRGTGKCGNCGAPVFLEKKNITF